MEKILKKQLLIEKAKENIPINPLRKKKY